MPATRLKACPASPNCVSSLSDKVASYIEPVPAEGDPQRLMRNLMKQLGTMPGMEIVTQEVDYIHVLFRSKLFKFIDDVEFEFVAEENVLHMRSASRTGYYDFGVNRRRLEQIRQTLVKTSLT